MARLSLKQRYENIIGWFSENMPTAGSELHFNTPFELIVAVILSAQCTDKRINSITPSLFRKYPDAPSLAAAEYDELFTLIKSVSYPNNKAAHLIAMARRVTEVYGGEVPSDIDELRTLQGVGPKTANVVASILFNAPVIAVDTHVFRLSRRLGLSDGKTPEKVERDLETYFPEALRAKAHHWLILHGRYVCTARKPHCDTCGLNKWCKTYKIISRSPQKQSVFLLRTLC